MWDGVIWTDTNRQLFVQTSYAKFIEIRRLVPEMKRTEAYGRTLNPRYVPTSCTEWKNTQEIKLLNDGVSFDCDRRTNTRSDKRSSP